MKRITLLILAFSLSALCFVIMPSKITMAVDVLSPVCKNADAANQPTVCKENQPNPSDNPILGAHGIVTTGVQILALIVGVVAVVVIVIAGARFITSSGDPESAGKARKALTYGVIGLLIAAFAQTIVSFVLNKLG